MNKNYYNMDKTQAEKVAGTASNINTWPSILVTFFGGYIFDIFGRKYTIYYIVLLSGFTLVLFPTFAPDKGGYIFCAVIYNFFVTPVTNNPLIQDYVCKESRSRAVSFSFMGLSLGVITSLAILFEFTKDADPSIAWGIMSLI